MVNSTVVTSCKLQTSIQQNDFNNDSIGGLQSFNDGYLLKVHQNASFQHKNLKKILWEGETPSPYPTPSAPRFRALSTVDAFGVSGSPPLNFSWNDAPACHAMRVMAACKIDVTNAWCTHVINW